jgi:hypothetical protein
LAGKVPKTLEKYRTIAQYQPAIRQPSFFGFVTTKILNRFSETPKNIIERSGLMDTDTTKLDNNIKNG